MFEKIENKIKEIADKIYKSNQSDQDEIYKNAKKIYELPSYINFCQKVNKMLIGYCTLRN